MPEAREAAGKARCGKIVLSATPADGQVCIEIRDDGRGIDPVAVRNRAAAMGLRTEADLDRMSNRELFSLILLPGFSTAKAVTDVSGRGVGMDVVKTNVEELDGSLTIDSWPGAGTSMLLRVPLTLAIVPCLIVTVGAQRYAVPQRELEEVVCLHPQLDRHLEQAFDTEVLRLR
ncbi:MAG: ATP-binding protein, partial [Phycisphaerae bacterium]